MPAIKTVVKTATAKRARYRRLLQVIIGPLVWVQTATGQPVKPQTPVMGWSSWNHFDVRIDEQLIKEQADAMVKKGLKAAGYQFINIDDGFMGGRNAKGGLVYNAKRFPNGMKALAGYIHSKGLKAGIYAEAGINTCAAIWVKDTIEAGAGLFGHDEQDLTLLLKTWGYDFLKVDWCGGERMGLNEQLRYTQIAGWIQKIKPQVIYNICRWQFPGDWAPVIADSWRISNDIANNFKSILGIINRNAALWQYCSPGHFNDMDMLQVGRGMTYEEDKAHFSMWCMMTSPLLLGNDLRAMSSATLSIITNKEIIALDQDPLCYQARRLKDSSGVQVWAKPLISTSSGQIAVALLNTNDCAVPGNIDFNKLGLDTGKGYQVRDLWEHEVLPVTDAGTATFSIPAHGIVVLKVTGKPVPFNRFESQ